MLTKLAKAGMNVARLNMSHGDHDSHSATIAGIKELNQTLVHPVALLIDTQGPEIRTGALSDDLELSTGDVVSVGLQTDADNTTSTIQINYVDLIRDADIGDQITIDNGLINLQVLEKRDQRMDCEVIDGGVLKSHSHVNLPGKRVNLPSITDKDKKDIRFAIEHEVDFIALSFVRDRDDIEEVRQLLMEYNSNIKVIAKIEEQEGLTNLESIIEASHGIMVARGDLGVEIPIEVLPRVQRRIVRECARYGRRVIVATHMLESMINNPLPTRAEVTDVANAVYEEADAIMLSAESAMGKYPVRCVEVLDRIALSIENSSGLRFSDDLILDTDRQEVASAAVNLAESLGAKAIIVPTKTGRMANYLANCHPQTPAICAYTASAQVCRQLALNRHVRSFTIDSQSSPDEILSSAAKSLLVLEEYEGSNKVVVVSDTLSGRGIVTIQIRYLDELEKL
jgi:pyruvate kinase